MRNPQSQGLKDFLRETKAVIEPVVAPKGLEWTGDVNYNEVRGHEYNVLFEATSEEFARKVPHLARDWGNDPVCVDLWIHYYPHSRTIDATLEAYQIDEWLERNGHNSLAEALRAPADLGPALETLAQGLRAMLEPKK